MTEKRYKFVILSSKVLLFKYILTHKQNFYKLKNVIFAWLEPYWKMKMKPCVSFRKNSLWLKRKFVQSWVTSLSKARVHSDALRLYISNLFHPNVEKSLCKFFPALYSLRSMAPKSDTSEGNIYTYLRKYACALSKYCSSVYNYIYLNQTLYSTIDLFPYIYFQESCSNSSMRYNFIHFLSFL